jgi:hypothetical protein
MAETLTDVRAGLYLGTRQGIFLLELGDGEANVLPHALHGVAVTALLADAKGNLLLAGTLDSGLLAAQGATAGQAEGGPAFAPVKGLEKGEVRALVVAGGALAAAVAPASIFHGALAGPLAVASGIDPLARARQRTAAGATAPEPARLTCLVARGDALLAGGEPALVARSDDRGQTFHDLTGNLDDGVLCLQLGPGKRLLAGGRQGLWQAEESGAGGMRWLQVFRAPEHPAVTAIAWHERRPEALVLGSARKLDLARPGQPSGAEAWLHASADGGRSFRKATVPGLPVIRGVVRCLAVAPKDPLRVFAGTSSGEVLESRDGGFTFCLAAATLPGVLAMVPGEALASP